MVTRERPGEKTPNTPNSTDSSGNGVMAFGSGTDVGSSFEKHTSKLTPVESKTHYISSITTSAGSNVAGNDPRVVGNLLDGHNYTTSELHVWQTPVLQSTDREREEDEPIAVITLEIRSKNGENVASAAGTVADTGVPLDGLPTMRLWNYNTSRIHSYKGVQKCMVTGNGARLYEGSVCKAPGLLTSATSASLTSMSMNRSGLLAGMAGSGTDIGTVDLDAEHYYQAISLNDLVPSATTADVVDSNMLRYDRLMGYVADERGATNGNGSDRSRHMHKELTVEDMLNTRTPWVLVRVSLRVDPVWWDSPWEKTRDGWEKDP